MVGIECDMYADVCVETVWLTIFLLSVLVGIVIEEDVKNGEMDTIFISSNIERQDAVGEWCETKTRKTMSIYLVWNLIKT